MSILGNRVIRKEDPHLITGGGTYVDSLPLQGALHVHFVRSVMAHALITSIDTTVAASAPGVVAVFTAADIEIPDIPPGVPMINQQMARPVLAKDRVRFAGEPVAVIVTEQRYQGEDAIEAISIDYDPLPAVTDPLAALTSETLLFPEAGTNLCLELPLAPHTEDFFADADVVVRQTMVNQRVAPTPIEVRAGAAEWANGKLTFWGSTQAPNGVKTALAEALGLDHSEIRVLAQDVGGGFGAKAFIYAEDIVLGWVARKLGKSVKWMESRSENMVAMTHGRGQIQEMELGSKSDGTITGIRYTITQEAGAYPAIGSFLPFLTHMMGQGVYAIPKIEFHSRSAVTNTTATAAYRGAGRPEATYAIERMLDILAAEIGVDPADVRRRNFISRDAFPFATLTGANYDIGDYSTALDKALAAAGYDDLRAEQARKRAAAASNGGSKRLMGIGVSAYVEVTNGVPGAEWGGVEIHPDGSATVFTASSPHGQGHVTAWSMVASERLGIPMDKIKVVHGDTDTVKTGPGTMGSRSLQTAGMTTILAADKVIEQATQVAADLLEAAPGDVVLDNATGRFHVAGSAQPARTWAEVAVAAPATLTAEVEYEAQPTFPFGAHVAVVEVDAETGKVELVRHVAVDDAGRILNPLLLEGQVHGGLAQGIAQALLEEVIYDADGNPLTSNLADYAMISACDLPMFETVEMQTPTPTNDLGAKGIGESGTIGSTPAVVNAVVDALSPFGIRHVDMPTTPVRVWAAIQAAQGSRGQGRP